MELEFKDKKLIFSDNAIAFMSLLPEGLVEQWQEKAFEVFGRTTVELAAPDLLEALKLCIGELYMIHSFYGDKANALENSNALRISEKAIEKAIK